jgi:UDP-N-acetylglucosamine 4,6-dehydratase
MKKVLITGGAGTVGSAFIKKYYNNYEFYNFSRGEEQIAELARKYPKVQSIIGDICNLDQLINVFERIKPDIVIHAAALKHVNLAELNPSQTVEINLVGSLNVIKASTRTKIPITVGISTDKACSPENVYGYSKKMMEMMFMEHHNSETKFVCTRFANVAGSHGSVIPFWKNLKLKGEQLKLTDPRMNRLMFSKEESAKLIQKAIDYTQIHDDSFVLSNIMNTVNMLDLAKVISEGGDIEIVGPRPGEKINETLISEKELPFTYCKDNYVLIFNKEQSKENNLDKELSSSSAKKMSKEQIDKIIE